MVATFAATFAGSEAKTTNDKMLGPVIQTETPSFVSPYLSDLMMDCLNEAAPNDKTETEPKKCYCQERVADGYCNVTVTCPAVRCSYHFGFIPQ